MDEHIKCDKCGSENNKDSRFCSSCGAEIIMQTEQNNNQVTETHIENNQIIEANQKENTTTNQTVETKKTTETQMVTNQNTTVKVDENDAEGTKLGIISLILYFGGSTVISIIAAFMPESIRYAFSALAGLCPLAGIVTMIVGRIKYPKNKLLKITMWIIIVAIALSIILFIFLFIMCYLTCQGMDTRGCD